MQVTFWRKFAACFLSLVGLEFYDKVGNHSCFGSPSTVFGLKTLLEVRLSCPTNYLKIFDYPVYVYVDDDEHDGKAKKFGFLGFEFKVNGYGFWCVKPKSLMFIVSKDLIFHEHAMRFVWNFESFGVGLDHSVCMQVELEKAFRKLVWILDDMTFVSFVCCKFKCC